MAKDRGGRFWLDRRILEHLIQVHAGAPERRPEIEINASALARKNDVKRPQVQKSLKRLVNKWHILALVRRPAGGVPIYKLLWDVSKKRRKHPLEPDPCPGEKGGCNTPHRKTLKYQESTYQDSDRPINFNKLAAWVKDWLQKNTGRPDLSWVILKRFKDTNLHRHHPAKVRFILKRIREWIREIRRRSAIKGTDYMNRPLRKWFGTAYNCLKAVSRKFEVERERSSLEQARRSKKQLQRLFETAQNGPGENRRKKLREEKERKKEETTEKKRNELLTKLAELDSESKAPRPKKESHEFEEKVKRALQIGRRVKLCDSSGSSTDSTPRKQHQEDPEDN